jgi:saposin
MKVALVIVALLIATVTQAQAFKPEKVENGALCTICTFVTNVIEEYLQNNATEAKIEQLLGKVCNLFGGFQSECMDFVTTETPAIIQLLLNKESPQTICTQLHACTSKFAEKPKVAEVQPEQGGALCSICQVVISTVESYLASNATETQIINGLENLCNSLPGSISATCDAIVEQYAPLAIQWLNNNEPPQVFCTQVGLCSSARPCPKTVKAVKPVKPVQPKPQQGGQLCGVCELVIASVEQYMQQNATEAQIIAFLENVCNALPGGVGSICSAVVDQYVPLMIQWLVTNESPSVFCTQVGLCSSETTEPKMLPLTRAIARPLTRLTRPLKH